MKKMFCTPARSAAMLFVVYFSQLARKRSADDMDMGAANRKEDRKVRKAHEAGIYMIFAPWSPPVAVLGMRWWTPKNDDTTVGRELWRTRVKSSLIVGFPPPA